MTDRKAYPQQGNDRYVGWSYEELEDLRQMAVRVRDCGIVWQHEEAHLIEIVARIEATMNLKRERESYWAKKGLPVPPPYDGSPYLPPDDPGRMGVKRRHPAGRRDDARQQALPGPAGLT
jgi:hypothetical protein